MEYKILKPSVNGQIATVIISRPEAMNALNSLFLKEMKHYITSIGEQKEIRVLIITGDGKAFVAGADIGEMADMNHEQALNFAKTGQEVLNLIENLEIPVIAAVNGFALGGGCELAMACDIRIASSKAKFGQPEVNLGLIPGYAGTQRLSRLTNPGNALYMICSAEMLTADEAMRIGLVQKVVEPEMLMQAVNELAAKIASKSPVAVRMSKRVIRKGYNMDYHKAMEMEAQEFATLFGKYESKEGMTAFLEKRPPKFS